MQSLTTMGVLIVDDAVDICTTTKELLECAGYQSVQVAMSVDEAFRLLGMNGQKTSHITFDAILMDVCLPKIGGIEACRAIKGTEHLQDISIIMVTGQSTEEVLQDAFSAGAMDYLTKPASTVELLARLRSALTLKQELDRRRVRERELTQLTRQLQERNDILQVHSTTDPVTGIGTRRCFDSALEKEWSRAFRDKESLTVIMVDCDNFKAFNDNYGHLKGDECLRQIAQAIQQSINRTGDLAARYGGEEFVLVLPNTNMEGARAIGQRLISKVQQLGIPHIHSRTGYVTVSCGICSTVPQSSASPGLLVAAADKALYQAKMCGKNQLQTASLDIPY